MTVHRRTPLIVWGLIVMGVAVGLLFGHPWAMVLYALACLYGTAALIKYWMTPAATPAPDLSKADMIRLAADGNMPHIDYETGAIWPPDYCREWLAWHDERAELERRLADVKRYGDEETWLSRDGRNHYWQSKREYLLKALIDLSEPPPLNGDQP